MKAAITPMTATAADLVIEATESRVHRYTTLDRKSTEIVDRYEIRDSGQVNPLTDMVGAWIVFDRATAAWLWVPNRAGGWTDRRIAYDYTIHESRMVDDRTVDYAAATAGIPREAL
jgi:hypothetical protein